MRCSGLSRCGENVRCAVAKARLQEARKTHELHARLWLCDMTTTGALSSNVYVSR